MKPDLTARDERIRELRKQGLSFTLIGERLGCSRNSVSSVLHRDAIKAGHRPARDPPVRREARSHQGWRTREGQRLKADAAKIAALKKRAAEERAKPWTPDPQFLAEAEAYRAQRARFLRVTDRASDMHAAPTRPIYRPGIDPRPAKYAIGVSR